MNNVLDMLIFIKSNYLEFRFLLQMSKEAFDKEFEEKDFSVSDSE